MVPFGLGGLQAMYLGTLKSYPGCLSLGNLQVGRKLSRAAVDKWEEKVPFGFATLESQFCSQKTHSEEEKISYFS